MNSLVLAKSPLKVRALVGLMRIGFGASANVSSRLTSRLALRVFLTPPRGQIAAWQKAAEGRARIESLSIEGRQVRLLHFGAQGAGDAVVLVHGWGGRATSLSEFVEPFLKQGLRVVAFDGPAHGASTGKRTDMMEFARTIHAVCEAVGPVRAVVAHSFGAACTLLANAQRPLPVARVVLISCFADAVWVTETFGRLMRLQPRVTLQMRRLLEQRHQDRWRWVDIAPERLMPKLELPLMLVHDEQDEEVPFANANVLAARANNAQLLMTQGLGHRKLLRDKSLIEQVVGFAGSSAST